MSNEYGSISCGVDWLTITTVRKEVTAMLYDKAKLLAKAMELGGQLRQEWYWRGYHGWSYGGFDYGERGAEGIARVYGESAYNFWNHFYPEFNRITRIDLQVTVQTPTSVMNVAYVVFENISLMHTPNCPKLKRNYSIVGKADKGQTLYVGSRESDQVGRLYDYGVRHQIAGPGEYWRYEVEFKRYRAKRVGKEIEKRMADGEQTLTRLINSTVFDWFEDRDIPTLFERSNETSMNLELQAKVSTLDRKLAWLATQVQPTIKTLFEQGYGDQTRIALGLPEGG